MKVINLNKENKEIWDGFIKDNPSGTFFHLSDWSFMCDEAFSYQNLSFMVMSGPEVLAIMPLSLRRMACFRFLESSGYGGCGGALFASHLSDIEKSKINAIINKHILSLSGYYSITAVNVLFSGYSNKELFAGINKKIKVKEESVYIVDLARTKECIWEGLRKNTRNAIRKAQASDLNIVKAAQDSEMEDFYGFIKRRYSQTGAKVVQKKYFTFLWERLGRSKDTINLFFVRKNNKNIGGILIAKFHKVATFLQMSSDHEMFAFRPNDLLIWRAIEWSKDNNCERYEVNRVFLKDRGTKKGQLGYFFSGFSKDIVKRYKVTMVYSPFKFSFHLILYNILIRLLPNR